MAAPEGIGSLEAMVIAAKPNATVTLPAAWLGELLSYVRDLEARLLPRDPPGGG